MNLKPISLGYGSYVMANRVLVINPANSAPVKRLIKAAKDEGLVVDSTFGRPTRSVLVMDSGHVVLSATAAETLAQRIGWVENNKKEE